MVNKTTTRYRNEGRCVHCGGTRDRAPKLICTRCQERAASSHKSKYTSRVAQALEIYGEYCACCGESEPMFLTIDHIDNAGGEHRRETAMSSIYDWLFLNGYPAGFQTLCWNCNCGRSRNGGMCPHESAKLLGGPR